MDTNKQKNSNTTLAWREVVGRYQHPDIKRSSWQLINSIVPYFALWVLMWFSLSVSYWITLALAILAAGFLVRIFIIFHDCGHGSFFKSKKANNFWGTITGVLTFTPYEQWRHYHALHHASSGNLDKRGFGDVWTLTYQEYLARPWLKRLGYRLFRHPIVMFGIGPIYTFLISGRFAHQKDSRRARKSVILTNFALLGIMIAAHFLIGIRAYLLIQLPVITISGAIGVWLFYVQHTFEPPYWERHTEWDFTTAALWGSSFYKLPKVLQWFSGNIGIHHIHHLSPLIPNYYLPQCQDENEIFHEIKPLTIRASLKSLNMRIWDEDSNRMLSFREMRRLYEEKSQAYGVKHSSDY